MPDPTTMALLTRLQALEQTLAALGSRSLRRSEAHVPTYLTVTPGGQVGALFTGGLQLLEQVSPNPQYQQDNSIGWVDPDTVIRQAIFAWETSGHHALRFLSQSDTVDRAHLQVSTDTAGGARSANVSVFAQDSTLANATRTILNAQGESSFVQVPGPPVTQALAIGHDKFSGTWPGGVNPITVTLNSGLSSIIVGVANVVAGPNFSGFYDPVIGPLDFTNPAAAKFSVYNVAGVPGAGIALDVHAIFIGIP